jgi:hypothetical protein
MVGVMNDRITCTSFQEAISRDKKPDPDLVYMAKVLAM